MSGALLGRFDAAAIQSRFEEAQVISALHAKGFTCFAFEVDASGAGLQHVRLYGSKAGSRHLLVDACVKELAIGPEWFGERGYPVERPVDLVWVYWMREEDPTAPFRADRPKLPLQHHPGLGVLRGAFHALLSMAAELGKDGIVFVPKLFHDAVIFYRSRLCLFLDGHRQGRFEALMRDLRPLPIGTASLALGAGAVRDQDGRVVGWEFAYQVFPICALLATYFNSAAYSAAVDEGRERSRFSYDPAALSRTPTTNGTMSSLSRRSGTQ